MSVEALSETRDEHSQARLSKGYVTLRIMNQLFGIPILQVQDVLSEQVITKIPASPAEVAGALNLRGRIVTAIDVRKKLNLPEAAENESARMNVVIEYEGELYSLIVDSIGEVLNLYDDECEKSPATLDKSWRSAANGVFQLEKELLVVLDVKKMLNFRMNDEL